ncbi:MAG: hypothetical protein Q9224_002422 [Gallowayella concinna]
MSSGHRRLGSRNVPESGPSKRKEPTSTPIETSAQSVPPLRPSEDGNQSPFGSQHGSPQHAGKMPIPRLKRNIDGPPAAGSANSSDNKHRVSHACEPCRQRKTKCSGERPICKHCEDFKIPCVYEDGKRDRTKKCAAPASSLQRADRVSEADQVNIQRLLNKDGNSGRDDSSTPASSRRRFTSTESERRNIITEHHVPARKGSIGSLDCIEEDLNRSAASRATGFMGKNSEVNWLGQLRSRTDDAVGNETETDESQMTFGSGLEGVPESFVHGPEKVYSASESTYHCDDISLVVPEHVQPYQLPTKETADLLLSCYLESVHPCFPILGKTTFVKQYHAFYDNLTLPTGPVWLAILNLLFALAARYGRLIRADWMRDADDEQIYFSRARLLALGSEALWVHGQLQRIQVTGLTSFYLMATNQLNRAFAMSGIAIRQAVTLGLNLRNQDQKLAAPSKEIRYRVWWALATTERTLCNMTGRPPSFAASDCSAPLPLPLDEDSFIYTNESYETSAVAMLRHDSSDESRSMDRSTSTPSSASSTLQSPSDSSTLQSPGLPAEASSVAPNTGLFFLYVSKLSCINDVIVKQLYRPPVMGQSWASVQAMMSKHHVRLEKWRSALPAVFNFTKTQRDQEFFRLRMCLGFSYYSTMIIIHRPGLCKIGRKIPNETERSKSIDQANAASCVFAARSVIDLLPDQPNTGGMYQVTPWWNMVHHLMQAVTVLMLELSLGSIHCPDIAPQLLQAAQKAVGWVQSMSADDMAAARAWRLSSELLRKIAPRVGGRIDDRLRYPSQVDRDVPMEDLLLGPTSHDALASSGYNPIASQGGQHTSYQPVTIWEPLMFTSYDDYLQSTALSDGQTSQPQHQIPHPQQHQPWI